MTFDEDGKPVFPVGVSVLMVHGGNVLLGRRKNNSAAGLYSTPGGRLEHDEDVYKCAIRELKEETGVDAYASDLEIIDVKEHFRYGKHCIMFYVKVTKWTGSIKNTEPEKCERWEWHHLRHVPLDCTEPDTVLAKLLIEPSAK